MVNAHYVIIDFRIKFFSKIQNQASDTSRSLPSFSSAPFLLRAVPSERLGQVYHLLCSWITPVFISLNIKHSAFQKQFEWQNNSDTYMTV